MKRQTGTHVESSRIQWKGLSNTFNISAFGNNLHGMCLNFNADAIRFGIYDFDVQIFFDGIKSERNREDEEKKTRRLK